MRYSDSLLADGEVVVRRARQHWFSLVIDGRNGWLLVLGGIIVLVLGLWIRGDGKEGVGATLGQLVAIVALIALVVGLVLFGLQVWRWLSQDYLVTNRRVIKVEGVLNKRAMDSSLEKINDAMLDQSVIGRIFDYGDLDIMTAAEVAVDKFRMLKSPTEFKRAILDQKRDLETEPHWATPPVHTGGPVYGGAGYPPAQGYAPQPPAGYPQAAPPAAAVPPQPPVADTATVTQTLARLADLRDRGAITAEEYEAKKAELLRRL